LVQVGRKDIKADSSDVNRKFVRFTQKSKRLRGALQKDALHGAILTGTRQVATSVSSACKQHIQMYFQSETRVSDGCCSHRVAPQGLRLAQTIA
jgi:hypothetical protein